MVMMVALSFYIYVFFKYLLRHLFWDFVRPKMTMTKMLILCGFGLFGSAKAMTMTSSPALQTLIQIGAYSCYFMGVFELFGLVARSITLHRLYFCCGAHNHHQ